MDVHRSFKILKLNLNASIDEAKRAHRKLASVWHPDRRFESSFLMRKRYEREMQKINVAYETVRSFLSSQQKKDPKVEAQAKAKTATVDKIQCLPYCL